MERWYAVHLDSSALLPHAPKGRFEHACQVLDAGDVAPVAGIDADDVTDVEEHGDGDDRAGLESGRLGAALDRVALETGLGLGDLEFDEHRRGDADELLAGILKLADIAFLEPLGIVTHDAFGHGQLVVGLGVHEVVVLTVGVEVLHLADLHADLVELLTGTEGQLVDAAGPDVADLGADESAALARLDMLELDDGAHLAIDDDALAVLEICR